MKTKPRKKLNNAQRITLIARTAWQKLDRAGAIDESFDEWRHREAHECCGVRISAANSDQLDQLETHFLALGGQTTKAYNKATGESGEATRQRYVIAQLAKQLGLPEGYAANKAPSQLRGIIINLNAKVREQKKGAAQA